MYSWIIIVTIRKDALVTGETYHVFTRSIAGFEVFRLPGGYERLIETFAYYNHNKPPLRFSWFLQLSPDTKKEVAERQEADRLVQILSYCLMPTHIHLVLKQINENGISTFVSNTLNSFTRYFNTAHKRKGPLWESEFKNVLVDTDEQLLQLTRYVHLNPVSAGLVSSPEDWDYSSYRQYIGIRSEWEICDWHDVLNIQPAEYKRFVEDHISYQRSLSEIKRLLIENYHG